MLQLLLAGKPGAMEIAQRLNAYHVRLRTVNRRMMAAVSELALTQATGIKLKEEKGSAEASLRAAIRRVEASIVFDAFWGASGPQQRYHIYLLLLAQISNAGCKSLGTHFGSKFRKMPTGGCPCELDGYS